jgi:SAM-dependent methyltransferase
MLFSPAHDYKEAAERIRLPESRTGTFVTSVVPLLSLVAMDSVPRSSPGLAQTIRGWIRESARSRGILPTLLVLAGYLWEFVRDSTPARRRQRYGDIDYDWDHRVDTTSATVGGMDRLRGLFHSPYQPTEPGLFREMLQSLPVDFSKFTFLDIGSGKGRTLLMASDFPFRRIVGVELLPALHRIARENVRRYKSDSQKCVAIEARCENASQFVFPLEATVLYLFHPLPEAGLIQLLSNLEKSLAQCPRPVLLVYHNPLLESVLAASECFHKIAGTHQYSIYANAF